MRSNIVENRSRKPKRLPVLSIAVLILSLGLILMLHWVGVLLAMGVIGLVSSFTLYNRVKCRLPIIFCAGWIAVMLLLSVSFIISGFGHIYGRKVASDLAAIEALRTLGAVGLFLFWLIGVKIVRRAKAPFIVFWSATALEAARLLALSAKPSPISYSIWAITALLGAVALKTSYRAIKGFSS